MLGNVVMREKTVALVRCPACTDVVSSLVRVCPICHNPLPASAVTKPVQRPTGWLTTPRKVPPSVQRVSHFPKRG